MLVMWLPLFVSGSAAEPEDADTLMLGLGEVEIVAPVRSAVSRLDGGVMKIDAGRLMLGMRSMGEADILNNIKKQPGVITAGDYGCGLMVDGAEPSQTLCRIAGAPVFFPYRFGGIFSTFNTSHFMAARFERGIHDASMPQRVGALIDFDSFHSAGERVSGAVNVGLLSSSLTVRIPLSKVSVVASGRVSYVDELYGRLLRGKDGECHYRFDDFNITANYRIDSNDRLSLNFLRSHDRLSYDDGNYAMDTRMVWNNTLVSANWVRTGNVAMDHRVFWSGFDNSFEITLPQMSMDVPSSLSVAGVAGDVNFNEEARRFDCQAGYELAFYRNNVQSVTLTGFGDNRNPAERPTMYPMEVRIYGNARMRPSGWLTVDAGLSLDYFRNGGNYNAFSPEPRLTATGRFGVSTVRLHAGAYGQNLHQVGFSETGMSSDFWIAASRTLPRQRALSVSAEYSRMWGRAGLTLTAEVFYKLLGNQPEYEGQMLDLLDNGYGAEAYIVKGSGYNAGINFALAREVGRLTGSLAVGYGVARRRYGDGSAYMRGRTDPGLTVAVDVSWRLGERWTLGADFRFASGRPYTPVTSIYIISGNLISVYGPHNSRRLPPTHRLNLSATVRLGKTGGETSVSHLLNFSIINAYGHRNVEFRKYVLDMKNGSFRIKEVASLYRFLPSVSYTLLF